MTNEQKPKKILKKNMREYHAWQRMKQLCENPNHRGYKSVGMKGIEYDSSWSDFDTFLKDMGPLRETECSILRKDSSLNFFKENCYWGVPEIGGIKKDVKSFQKTKKFKDPREICITLENDIYQLLLRCSAKKTIDEGKYYSANDVIRMSLETIFKTNQQLSMTL